MSTNFATVDNYKEVIKAAETADLLEFYNKHVDKPIKKFESRAVAESRVIKLVDSMPPVEELTGTETSLKDTNSITLADIKEASIKLLVDVYNQVTGESIKNFSDKKMAVTKTWNAIKRAKNPKQITKRQMTKNRIIHLLTKENHKRPNTRAHKKWAVLLTMDGKTIQDFKNEEGKHPDLDKEQGWAMTELRYGINRNLVKYEKQD